MKFIPESLNEIAKYYSTSERDERLKLERLLSERNLDINNLKAALTTAIRNDYIDIVYELVKSDLVDDATKQFNFGIATHYGSPEIVRIFIDHVNIEGFAGGPLKWAIKSGNIDKVKMLLDAGASVGDNNDALRMALVNKQNEIAKLIKNYY